MATVELRFAALPGHVRTARMIVAAIGRRSGVPHGILDEIKLAVGEACSRAVTVNSQLDPTQLVIVRVGDDDSFAVSVIDCGPVGEHLPRARDSRWADLPELPFGSSRPEPGGAGLVDIESGHVSLEHVSPSHVNPDDDGTSSPLSGGLGLALIEGLVDDFDITTCPDSAGTIITMRWPTDRPVDTTADDPILAS